MNRTMKDSGIPWVGEIPDDWDVVKGKVILSLLQKPVLEDDGIITCFRDGEVTLRSNRRTEGFTISMQEIGYQGIDEGDLVVHGMDGFAGAIGISDSRGKATPVLNVMDSTENKRYLMYYLRSMAKSGLFFALSTGIRVRSCDTNWNKIKSVEYLVPSKPEQKKIADYLDKQLGIIDSLISDTKSAIENLKKLKVSIVTEAITKGLDPMCDKKDSGITWIGEVPSTWEVMPLKYLYDFSTGCAVKVGPFGSELSSSDLVDEGVWVYNQRVVVDNNFKSNDTFVTEEKAKELSGFQVLPGDLLITTRGTIGRIAIVPDDAQPGVLHPCVIKFRIDETKYSKELLKVLFNQTDVAKGQILNRSNSTTIEVLYSYSLKEIRIPVPTMKEQETILKYVNSVIEEYDGLIEEKEEFCKLLEQYKVSLTYEYVTGKRVVD